MANKKISEMTPITNSDNIKDDYILPIVLKEGETLSNRSVSVEVLRGAINKGGADYVELSAPDGSKFRVKMNKEGKFVIYPIDAFEGTVPDPSASGSFNGLIINSMYGGGDKNSNNTPCSHHYIELYNNQPNGLDLNLKGLYLSIKGATGGWTSLALEGIIPYQHSFLVRGRQISDPVLLGTRMKVDNYDMEWDINFPEDGFSAYLSIGEPPTDSQGGNPWNHDGNNNKAPGYIDMLAAGGLTTDKKVQAYEYRYGQFMSKDIGIRRLDFCQSAADFAFKDQPENNQTAARALDFRICDVETYKPRCIKDGKWDIYFDKLKLKENVPNLVNICYGKDGETTRTFTYQTPVMDEGWVRYRKVNTNKWNTVETQREIVSHFDTEATIHRAIIRDLEPGEYEYQCGTEGMWSDIAVINVKKYEAGDTMRILWTSDQQGWTTEQYQAWKVNYQNIVEQEPEGWDWHLNTGDISQNANRSFEWRGYFQYSLESTRNCCHMITCGNNDLADKTDSKPFTYYMTAEDHFLPEGDPNKSPYISAYSYDLGPVHFVSLNSNNKDKRMMELATGDPTNVDGWIQKECEWLDADLTKDEANDKTKWTVVYMHLSPFTIIRPLWLQRFIPVFEKHRVHIVLCGHNHTYSRSIPVYCGYDGYPKKDGFDATGVQTAEQETALNHGTISHAPDWNNGTTYIMNQAAGFKLSGKEIIQGVTNDPAVNNNATRPWWYGYVGDHPQAPTYAVIEISDTEFNCKTYQIKGIVVKDKNENDVVAPYGTQQVELIDEITVPWRTKGQTPLAPKPRLD